MQKLLLLPTLGLVLAGCLLAACADSGETETNRTTTRRADERTTTRRAVPPRQETRPTQDDGGFLEALASAFEDDTGACVDAISARLEGSRGKTVTAVARDVERLRRLRFQRIPTPRYLPPRRLARRVLTYFERAYPPAEAERDERALIALGVLPERSNLKAILRRLLTAEVSGFYDPRTGELVVESDADRRLDAFERVILAHELEHALADQALTIPSYLEADRPAAGAEDAAVAGQALIEGDATLTMEAYALSALSFLDALSAIGPALAAEQAAGDVPHYFEASLSFPYFEGASFVCALYERGGWRAVDRAYANPPTTSAQIMFPERYFAREDADFPPAPRSPGRGWTRLSSAAIGAADLLWLFEAPGDDAGAALSDARERAAAWAGGTLHVWARGERTAVALALVERRGERDLCASMRAWLQRLGEVRRRKSAVRCRGRSVLVAIAPTLRTARAVTG